jgi:hypothetical protein
MSRFVLFAILAPALSLAGCGSQSRQCASPDAPGIVAALQPEAQFKEMLKRTVEGTVTYATAVKQDGSVARKRAAEAIDAAVERHGDQWERNVTSGWATLDPAELGQVCKALSERDQSTFMRFAERVGPDVQARNEPLLKRTGVEVLKSVSPVSE